jgi:monoamine oxidase
MSTDADVIIIGAGVSGLAAAAALSKSGRKIVILEARDWLGGRVLTREDPVCHAPIEFGAEFIHGLAPAIWKPLQKRNVNISEVKGDNWCWERGSLSTCDFFSEVEHILEKMDDRSPDESFVGFLERCFPDSKQNTKQQEAKERALEYVSGFNAADPELVGVHWLVKGMRAEEKIEGDRAFRPATGYASLIDTFLDELSQADVSIQTSMIVDEIDWKRGHSNVRARGLQGIRDFTAPRIIVTLPLAVLQATPPALGAVRFSPPLPGPKLEALTKLEMGKVIRVVLRFSHRFWDAISPQGNRSKTLAGMSFLFSQDQWFPTWWTTLPAKFPIITGWAPFRSAERLSGKDRSFVVAHSLQSLGLMLNIAAQDLEPLLEAAYFHDWQSDPFSRGAYSYGKVGADGAQEALASPVDGSLFFAGEATDTTGRNGTVDGAIASGRRAAAEILCCTRARGAAQT